MPTTPNDPLYPQQWHFSLIGDIETIWDDYNGSGVNVGVYDSGVDYNHVDLNDNYDSSLQIVDGLGNAVDPFPISGSAHGTAVAGLIGAEANNGTGGVGVASGVTLTGVNIFESTLYGFVNNFDTTEFMDSISQAANNFDITSHSWGSTPGWSTGQNLTTAQDGTRNSFAAQLNAEYELLSENGRGGLGTLVAQAAGNDNLNANGSGVNSSRFTITVAATEQDGTAASYTNYGSGILVTAPAAAVTTDITGAPGYNSGSDPIDATGDYTSTFNGTSAATPVVSGVISLMLEANAGLGWRDVHNILANSATQTGSSFGSVGAGTEDGSWFSTTAGNWNGGGHTFHVDYGYGMVNAFNAVRMAEVWTTMTGGAFTSANEQSVSVDSGRILRSKRSWSRSI
jgi:subtilisin family serine protease